MLWRERPNRSKEGLLAGSRIATVEISLLTETSQQTDVRLARVQTSNRFARRWTSRRRSRRRAQTDKLAEEESKIGKTKTKTVQDEVEKDPEAQAPRRMKLRRLRKKSRNNRNHRGALWDSKDDDHAKLSKRDGKAAERKDDRNSKRKSSDDDETM